MKYLVLTLVLLISGCTFCRDFKMITNAEDIKSVYGEGDANVAIHSKICVGRDKEFCETCFKNNKEIE